MKVRKCMTEKEKRDKQELYNANYDNEIIEEMKKTKDLCYEYNNIKPSERKLRCQNRYMDTFNERVYNELCTLI